MTLHIVTGSDDNYVAGVLVLLASAAFHNRDLRLTVLDLGISAANRARLDALGDRIGAPVERIEVPADVFDHVPVRRAHLTRGTFLRLLIPALMPGTERVIYMDCDMVVLGTIIRETIGAIGESRKTGFNPTFLGSSAAYTDLIHKLGGKAMDGVYATMTVQNPYLDETSQPIRFWANKYKTKKTVTLLKRRIKNQVKKLITPSNRSNRPIIKLSLLTK